MKKLVYFTSFLCLTGLVRAQSELILNEDTTIPAIAEYVYIEQNNHMAYINWGSVQEQNLKHYVIERSYDGFNFTSIGTMEGNLFSYKSNGYQFIDEFPVNGLNHYRIKAVGMNGREVVLGQVTTKVTLEAGVVAYSNNGKMNIRASVPVASLELVDKLGNTYSIERINNYAFECADLPEGKYELRAKNMEGQTTSLKIRHN